METILLESKVPDKVLEYFDLFLTKVINNPKLILQDDTCTVNGKQSVNLIDNLDKNLKKSFVENFVMPNIKKFIGHYTISGIDFDYLHIIKYNEGGKQSRHTHQMYEDYGFIIYLNDGDGYTTFYPSGDVPKKVYPKRGKIVLFSSFLVHEATTSTVEKKVVVGSLREVGKIWSKRNYKI